MTEAPIEHTPPPPQHPPLAVGPLSLTALILATLISALWGTNPTALKIALRGLPPIGASGLRFAIASVGVYAVCRATGVSGWPRRGEFGWLAGASAFFVAQIATFTLGVYWGRASHSIVLLHTYPFFVVALAHFLIPGDRATPGRILGLVAAFAGIVALFAGEWGRWQRRELLGDCIQLISAFVLGSQVVFVKHAVARISPHRVVLWQMIVGAFAFLSYSLAFEGLAAARPDLPSAAAVLYQGLVIGTLCFTIWTWLLHRHAASRIAIFGFVAPLVGVAASVALLAEPLTPALLLSAALVAAGIVTANLW